MLGELQNIEDTKVIKYPDNFRSWNKAYPVTTFHGLTDHSVMSPFFT